MHANLPMTELLPAPFCAKPDIVRRFLAWAQTADADVRAQGASALARAYLYSDLPAFVRAEAVLAMTVLLDDPSILVRRALAEALCRARDAPRAVVLALAADGNSIVPPSSLIFCFHHNTGQSSMRAMRCNSREGLTATGCPTAPNNQRSLAVSP